MSEEVKEEKVVKEVEETKVESKKETKKKVEKMPEKKEEIKVAAPKLFFKADTRIEIVVNGYHSKETGELMFVLPLESSEKSFDDIFTKVEYKFWFSRVPYDKLNRYRSRSMIYNSEDQNNTINEIRLREFFLVFHLVDWNLTDENGEKVELKFDTNKALSDESLNLIYNLPSNLIDVVLAQFERKMNV